MTTEELEAVDTAYREHLRQKAIDELERGLARAKAQGGRTDCIERELAKLRAMS